MGLAEQFELLELIHRDKAETWLARERNSNRRLLLHKFKETTGLRERLLAMGPADLIMLVSAEKEGDSYIVITHDAPVLRKFSDWAESRSATSVPVEELSREKTPAADPQRTIIMPARAREAQISGEFDLLFNAPAPSPVRSPFDDDSVARPVTASSPGLTNESVGEPGEFTRFFQTPASSSASNEPAPARTDAPPSPGEFTLMFRAPTSPPANKKDAVWESKSTELGETGNASAPRRSSSLPGDFTRAFTATPAPTEPPASREASQSRGMQKPAQPTEDEFANSFQSAADAPTQSFPPRPSWEARKSTGKEPGEFTRIFANPFATPADDEKIESSPPSQPQRPNRSARPPEMFPRSPERTPYDSASDALDGGATGIFVNPKPPATDSFEPPRPVGPSEYTQIFRQPVTPPQEVVKEAETPKQQATARVGTPPAKSPLPLMIILAILAIAAIALMLYFSLRR